jgi:hypothetical protein
VRTACIHLEAIGASLVAALAIDLTFEVMSEAVITRTSSFQCLPRQWKLEMKGR